MTRNCDSSPSTAYARCLAVVHRRVKRSNEMLASPRLPDVCKYRRQDRDAITRHAELPPISVTI